MALAQPTHRLVDLATLNAAARKRLKPSQFALPPKGGKPGAYPIKDENHARNALTRVSQFGNARQKAIVKAAVRRKFPQIKVSGSK